jgi:hypothetical protein
MEIAYWKIVLLVVLFIFVLFEAIRLLIKHWREY